MQSSASSSNKPSWEEPDIMSCHLSITSVIPCCIRDHSPKSDTYKTPSLAVLLRKITFRR